MKVAIALDQVVPFKKITIPLSSNMVLLGQAIIEELLGVRPGDMLDKKLHVDTLLPANGMPGRITIEFKGDDLPVPGAG